MNILLQAGDLAGFSFFLSSLALLAATAFFFLERNSVSGKWKLPITVATLITGISAIHYYYLKHVWLLSSSAPTELRYIDWILTIPLICIEFYLILRALGHGSKMILYRLFGYSTAMIVFGYLGEVLLIDPMLAIGAAVIFYVLILFEIFKGDVAKAMDMSSNVAVKSLFKILRLFVLIGIVIYPLGGYLGLHGIVDVLNIVDVVNKIGFTFIIYLLAQSDSQYT